MKPARMAGRFVLSVAGGLAVTGVVLSCRPSPSVGPHPTVQTPEPESPAVSTGAPSVSLQDSLRIAEAAMNVFGRSPYPLHVVTMIHDREGTLVRVSPRDIDVIGGGGLVWVHTDGQVVVLRRYQ
jgi:hypothetical protein